MVRWHEMSLMLRKWIITEMNMLATWTPIEIHSGSTPVTKSSKARVRLRVFIASFSALFSASVHGSISSSFSQQTMFTPR